MGSRGRRSGQATTNASVESISGHRSKGTSSSSALASCGRGSPRPCGRTRSRRRCAPRCRCPGRRAARTAGSGPWVRSPRSRRSSLKRSRSLRGIAQWSSLENADPLADVRSAPKASVATPRRSRRGLSCPVIPSGAERHHDLGLGGREQVAYLGHERLARHPAQSAVGMPEEPEVGCEPDGAPRVEVPARGRSRRLAGRERRVGDAAGVAAGRRGSR